jgi:hypothetical protein
MAPNTQTIAGERETDRPAIGVIMLDTRFPRLLGDIGNALTWPFPVTYRVARGAYPARMARAEPDGALLAPFVEAARHLETQGARAIATSCGFLAAYQRELAAAVSIPVFSSALLQVPMAARTMRPGQRVAILTAAGLLNERHFNGVGWSAEDIPVVQLAPPPDSHFIATFVGNAATADPALLRREVARLTERLVAEHDDVGAVVLECANLAPFAPIVRRIANVAVFDLYTLCMHAYLATTGTDFDRARTDREMSGTR